MLSGLYDRLLCRLRRRMLYGCPERRSVIAPLSNVPLRACFSLPFSSQKMNRILNVFKPAPAAKAPSGGGFTFGATLRTTSVGPAVNERKKMLQGQHAQMVNRLEAPIVSPGVPSSSRLTCSLLLRVPSWTCVSSLSMHC